jgi:hypothetical protein
MKLGRCAAAAAAIAALLLVGCEQRQHTTQVTPSAPPMQARDAAAAASSTADPSLPPAEAAAASKTAQDAAVTLYDSKKPIPDPAAETGRDGSAESALTADERDRQMPMKGQANDYNTPDRAKEGDQPNTASKEPGGQEANPGNQTSASK